jgi:ketosteroid isomerase-like protein
MMTSERALEETDIRRRIESGIAAIRAFDLEGVMALYAPDIVSFDIEPPLQHLGAVAKRTNWSGVFRVYQPPLEYVMHDLTLTVGGDVAFGHSLNHIRGTLRNGIRSDHWVRWTACFRKIDGTWRITHDHVSAPLDFASGKALLDLEP